MSTRPRSGSWASNRCSAAASLPEDDRPGAAPVALIGHSVFVNRYGSNPSVIGRSVRINDVPTTIIGVMPEGFKFPFNTDVWLPLGTVQGLDQQRRNARNWQVFGHLAPGVTREQAQSELINISRKLEAENPDTNKDIQARVQTYHEAQNPVQIRTVFLSLMGAVAFVLLIACANVANLLLSRSTNRAREISVRISLGASRWRIIRQLLIESVILAVISGLAGLGIAAIGIEWFDRATVDAGRPYWIQFNMDLTVLSFFAFVCLGTGILFGLAPALHVSKTDVNDVLKEGGRTGSAGVRARRWTGVLMVAELTLTVVLLAGAGFMIRNFLTMYRLDLGIDTSQLLTMNLALPERKYPARRAASRVLRATRATAESQSANRERDDYQQQSDAGRVPAPPRNRRQATRPGAAGAERDDADDRSALLQDHRPAAAARPRPHRRRRHDGTRKPR